MISFFSCQNWRAKWATPVLVTNERPAFILCTLLCAHESNSPHFIHPSPTLLFEYTPEQYKHDIVTVFFWFNSLFFAFVSFSWLSRCFFLVTTCTRLGLGWFYRLLWLHTPYNTALNLSKLAHWRLKWAPGVPLWPPSTVVADRYFCLQCNDLRAYHFTHYY